MNQRYSYILFFSACRYFFVTLMLMGLAMPTWVIADDSVDCAESSINCAQPNQEQAEAVDFSQVPEKLSTQLKGAESVSAPPTPVFITDTSEQSLPK